MERDEIDRLFKTLPAQGPLALRDQALLMLLYNTGARVQEIVDLRVGDVDLDGPLRAPYALDRPYTRFDASSCYDSYDDVVDACREASEKIPKSPA